jgi:hypothetical protein
MVQLTRRRVALSALVAVILLVGGAAGARWWHYRSYVGTSRQTILQWGCVNDIFYEDTSRTYDWWAALVGQKRRRLEWWAGRPKASGPIETAEPKPQQRGFALHEARGRIHFDSLTKATFTSDAGGTMPMVREPASSGHTDECLLSRVRW